MNNQTNHYSPPDASLVGQSPPLQLASRTARFFASLIDSIISLVFSIVFIFYSGAWDQIQAGVEPSFIDTLPEMLASLLFFTVINGHLLASKGQTIGKLALRIKIVDLNGNLIALQKLIGLRILPLWVIASIPIIGSVIILVDACFIFREDKRCLHDFMAGSQVVNAM